MKKILLFELCLLLLATNFQSDNPPGWYQQTLPVNDFVNDIFFIDTLTGWVVTQGHTNNQDTAYIMKTTNGGDNWTVQYSRNMNMTTVQFTDHQTGYVGGASGTGTIYVLKTTNGGDNWIQIMGTTAGTQVDDMFFLNSDTGWICDSPNLIGFGLIKTTNGGLNWFQQLDNSYRPLRVHFINADTGWMGTNEANGRLYRTTNGGNNWELQYTHSSGILDVYFFNANIGILTSGLNLKTTNGGFNWESTNDGGGKISMGNDSVGWAGRIFSNIVKTTNQGTTWFVQTTPIFNNSNVYAVDENTCFAGGSGIVKTTDGGGPTSIFQINNTLPNVFDLFQNYPNPFNPTTNIKFNITSITEVRLKIYDSQGKEIKQLINEKLPPGEYNFLFDGTNLTSGIYFYRLEASDFMSTRKMVLIK